MSQVSKIKLDKSLEKELFVQFWNSLARINSSGKAVDFFSDLLSPTEQTMLAKRLAAAILINKGKSATEVHSSLHLSFSAISSVTSWAKNPKPATNILLRDISNQKDWEEFTDIVDGIIDLLPPRRHTNWSEEYKKKVNRNKLRNARKSLR